MSAAERPRPGRRPGPAPPGERARPPKRRARGRHRPYARSRAPTRRDGTRPQCRAPAAGDGERGSATVLAVGVVAALVLFAGAFAAMGQASAARHRAQGAADAAALAGAARVLLGGEEACGAASAMAGENGVDLERCEVKDLEVTIIVTVEPAGLPALFGPARAVSRAGPVMAH